MRPVVRVAVSTYVCPSSWNLQGLSRPVRALLYLQLFEHTSLAKREDIFHLRSLRFVGSVVLSMGLFRGKVAPAQCEYEVG